MYATAEWGAGSDVAGVEDIRGLIRQRGRLAAGQTPFKKSYDLLIRC
jgi:hypothetical protein